MMRIKLFLTDTEETSKTPNASQGVILAAVQPAVPGARGHSFKKNLPRAITATKLVCNIY